MSSADNYAYSEEFFIVDLVITFGVVYLRREVGYGAE